MTKKEFYDKYCMWCGTQICGGPDDELHCGGCPTYRKEILGKDTPSPAALLKEIMEEHEKKQNNKRVIKRLEANGSYTEIEVDWNKLPCAKCDRRYHLCCPKPNCWNKDGKYVVY